MAGLPDALEGGHALGVSDAKGINRIGKPTNETS